MSIAQYNGTQVRGITLWQPWASLIALGAKQFETRSWSTNFRGKLLIHAAARKASFNPLRQMYEQKGWAGLSDLEKRAYLLSAEINKYAPSRLACVVAIADLTDCLPMFGYLDEIQNEGMPHIVCEDRTPLEIAVGDWQPGRYAWKLENIQAIEPIPYKGKQGLWVPSSEFIEKLGVVANA